MNADVARRSLAISFLLLLTFAPSAALAQSRDEVRAARARLRHEPGASETVQAALRYFRVHPDALEGLRSAARARAAVPLLAGGYRYDEGADASSSEQRMFEPNEVDATSSSRTHAVTAGAIWDLRDAVFNPAEVQVYGLVGVQRDVMLEVTRTFFMRRQLLLRLLLRPPADELARLSLELRIEELTAVLDSMTGGWYSRTLLDRFGGDAETSDEGGSEEARESD